MNIKNNINGFINMVMVVLPSKRLNSSAKAANITDATDCVNVDLNASTFPLEAIQKNVPKTKRQKTNIIIYGITKTESAIF